MDTLKDLREELTLERRNIVRTLWSAVMLEFVSLILKWFDFKLHKDVMYIGAAIFICGIVFSFYWGIKTFILSVAEAQQKQKI